MRLLLLLLAALLAASGSLAAQTRPRPQLPSGPVLRSAGPDTSDPMTNYGCVDDTAWVTVFKSHNLNRRPAIPGNVVRLARGGTK
jgi:hypothetical protein